MNTVEHMSATQTGLKLDRFVEENVPRIRVVKDFLIARFIATSTLHIHVIPEMAFILTSFHRVILEVLWLKQIKQHQLHTTLDVLSKKQVR